MYDTVPKTALAAARCVSHFLDDFVPADGHLVLSHLPCAGAGQPAGADPRGGAACDQFRLVASVFQFARVFWAFLWILRFARISRAAAYLQIPYPRGSILWYFS